MGSDSDIVDEKKHVQSVEVSTREVDTAAQLAWDSESTLDPAEALRVR
jgi:hypothetical protein